MPIQKKVSMLGDFAVGKTSLVRRYVEDRFDDKYLSTIGVKVSRKVVSIGENDLHLLLWDLAGGDDFRHMGASYLRGSAAALIVCDLTRPETLDVCKEYIDQLASISPQASSVLVGNKSDLVNERTIDDQALIQVASTYNIPSILTSAKTGESVEEAFKILAEQIEV